MAAGILLGPFLLGRIFLFEINGHHREIHDEREELLYTSIRGIRCAIVSRQSLRAGR
jgi:hypothetical protein